MPITLDVTEDFATKLQPGSSKVALRDAEGVMLAVLHVEEVWQPDRKAEAKSVFNTSSTVHPGADYLLNKGNSWYVGGHVEGVQMPRATETATCEWLSGAPNLHVWDGGG
jgi:sulfate adenylyltransferase